VARNWLLDQNVVDDNPLLPPKALAPFATNLDLNRPEILEALSLEKMELCQGVSISPEVRERAVRMYFDHRPEYPSEWAAITGIAGKLGMTPETLRKWVRRAETDNGKRAGLTTDERARLKALEKGSCEAPRDPRDPEGSLDFLRDPARRSTE